jgi:hypothetical protein
MLFPSHVSKIRLGAHVQFCAPVAHATCNLFPYTPGPHKSLSLWLFSLERNYRINDIYLPPSLFLIYRHRHLHLLRCNQQVVRVQSSPVAPECKLGRRYLLPPEATYLWWTFWPALVFSCSFLEKLHKSRKNTVTISWSFGYAVLWKDKLTRRELEKHGYKKLQKDVLFICF